MNASENEQASGPEIRSQIQFYISESKTPCNISMETAKRKKHIHCETNVVYKDVQCTALHQKLILQYSLWSIQHSLEDFSIDMTTTAKQISAHMCILVTHSLRSYSPQTSWHLSAGSFNIASPSLAHIFPSAKSQIENKNSKRKLIQAICW